MQSKDPGDVSSATPNQGVLFKNVSCCFLRRFALAARPPVRLRSGQALRQSGRKSFHGYPALCPQRFAPTNAVPGYFQPSLPGLDSLVE